MKAHVIKSVIGYFAFDDNENLLHYKLFKPLPMLVRDKLKSKIDNDFTNNLSGYSIVEDYFAKKIMRKKLREFAVTLSFVKDEKEFNNFFSELGVLMSKEKMKTVITKDKIVVQASNTLTNIIKVLNLLTEHLKEWYGLHYPELKINDKKLIQSIIKYGTRENFPRFKTSTGIEFDEQDEKIVREFATQINALTDLKNSTEKYVKETMQEIAPNFSCLIDILTSAKLLALAGSLEKLAKSPSSTIQLLGSEKALFRHLKDKRAKSPKYGILYETGYIKKAPEDKKGKIARIIASKLSIAAKIDFYSQRDEREKLKNEIKEEIKKVMKSE